jgi:pimeloyl-ACP methyl ester carboxylesterase
VDLMPWPGEPDAMVVPLDSGDRLHYLDWRAASATGGADALPPLVLLHGLSQTAWSWAPICRRLATRAPLLAVDLRGHGLSDSPRSGYDLDSLAFDVLTVVSGAGWGVDVGGPPIVCAGHGLGAMVAVEMARLRPLTIAGLGLVDAGWEHMAEATGMDAAEFQRTIGDPPEVLASMDAYLADRREYDEQSWDADQERAARSAVDAKHAGHVAPVIRPHALRGAIEAMWSYDPAWLVELDMPLLIAIAESGGADDDTGRERLLALDEVLSLRQAADCPPSRLARYPGTGHNLMRYRPAELSAALLGLLELASTSARGRGGQA